MWKGKVVCVAGGSRGFGWHVAQCFHQQGARVVLLARDEAQLSKSVDQLNQPLPDTAFGIPVNLADDQLRKTAIESIVEQHGGIDVWVNAVGQSVRTDFARTDLADYRCLMEQNFFISAGCSLDVLTHLEDRSGHLVNIGSLASKTAWRYVAPYVTSKHALAGFASQLRLEGPQNVHYLFVCPGPIQSDHETGQRYAEQTTNLPDKAAQPGAGAPVSLISPEWLADKVIKYCERRKPELVVPWKSRLLFSIAQLFPNWGDRLVRKLGR